jgi:SAM-dependent methyltransferase
MATHAERSMSFGGIADDYDRLRAGPAPEAVDWLLPARRAVVVDLAAGTGLLTRALAGTARHVIAVEPDDRMRSVLQARSPAVEVLAGRGEAIPLPDASADAVFVSSAWHWMDPSLAVQEIARVLRDQGRFGVISTGWDRATAWIRPREWFRAESQDAWAAGRQSGDAVPPDTGADQEPGGRHITLPEQAEFDNIETATFHFMRSMTVTDLVDMLTTYSWVITASPADRAAGRARAVAALAEHFPGATGIEVPMRSRCWRADRVSRTAS